MKYDNLEGLRTILHRAFFVFAFFSMVALKAQKDPLHTIISTQDGLPSNEIYFSFEDSIGNIWIGTDRGLVVYDGSEMKILTIEDGLPGDVILKYYEDYKGRLWFITYKNGVFYLKNDSITVPPFNKNILKKTISLSHIKYIYIDSSENIIFNYRKALNSIFIAEVNSEEIYCVDVDIDSDESLKLYEVTFDNKFIFGGIISLKDTRDCKSFPLTSVNKKITDKLKFKEVKQKDYPAFENMRFYNLHTSIGDDILFSIDNELYVRSLAENVEQVGEFPESILCFYETISELYVGTYKKGIYLFAKNEDGYHFKANYLDGRSVSDISMSKNGDLWVSTLTGLIQMPSITAFTYRIPDSIFLKNDVKDNFLFTGDSVLIMSNDKIYILGGFKNSKELQYVNTINLDSNYFTGNFENIGWGSKGELLLKHLKWDYFENNPRSSVSLVNERLRGLSIYKISFSSGKDTTYYHLESGFIAIFEDSIILDTRRYNATKRATCIQALGESNFLMGTYNGLYRVSSSGMVYLRDENELFKLRISDIKRDSKGRIFIATQGKGLMIIDSGDTILINENSGLLSDYCSEMILKNNVIYIATLKGLNKILLKESGEYQVQSLNFNRKLELNRITHLYEYRNDLIIQSGPELIFISLDDYFPESPTPVIRHVATTLDGRPLAISGDGKYKYQEGGYSFQISLDSRHFHRPGEVFYKYRLKRNGNNWITNTSGIASFQNLASGNYTLEAKARNNAGIWSDPLSINFEIIPPWYQRWWFTLIWVGALLLIIIGIARWRYKRLETNRKLLTYNIRALSLQINPHFVFNALNSVQYFIATNQKREANLFLAKISTLIRGVLSNADSNTISLALEIKRLKDYIELEKMRLTDQFNYTLEVDKAIDPEKINIMPLLIQPSVENAIWHGMSDISYPGKLHVKVYLKGKNLIVEVSDNGPGIPEQVIKAIYLGQVRGSIGLQNTMARMQAMSKIEDKEYKMLIENKKNPSNIQSIGTQIKLIFPAYGI